MKATRPKSNFVPCPEGTWPGVCIDVVDKGMVPTGYGPKHKVQFRFLADAEPRRADRKPYFVSKKVNLSMGKKSNLRPMLELWRGKKFATEDEAYEFELDTVIGAPCQLQVSHESGDDGPYAIVQAVFKAIPGVARVAMPTDYTREKDRPGYVAPEVPEEEDFAPAADFDTFQATEEDLPF